MGQLFFTDFHWIRGVILLQILCRTQATSDSCFWPKGKSSTNLRMDGCYILQLTTGEIILPFFHLSTFWISVNGIFLIAWIFLKYVFCYIQISIYKYFTGGSIPCRETSKCDLVWAMCFLSFISIICPWIGIFRFRLTDDVRVTTLCHPIFLLLHTIGNFQEN